MPNPQSKPSPQGKASAAIAAGIVGYGAYATYKHNLALPNRAQTSVKVPSSANMPPRGAASASATSQANWYSTRARGSMGGQNLAIATSHNKTDSD